MRLIDADKLLKDIEQYHLSDGMFQHWVEVQPTITIEERKKGRWMMNTGLGTMCSNCYYKLETTGLLSKCPNCGARMGEWA